MAEPTTQLIQDSANANKGTVRGRGMVERSLQQYGAGRSVLVDRNGVIIAGACIYTLSDPDSGAVRYVGKTDFPYRRYHTHLAGCHAGESYVQRWVHSLKLQGKRPVMTIIEECPAELWPEREVYWIEEYRTQGALLTNSRDGGFGGQFNLRPESCQKISKARTGMKFTDEHRERLRQRKNELWQTERGMEIRNGYSRQYAKMSDEQVLDIILQVRTKTSSQAEMCRKYQVPTSTVSQIMSGKRYKHVPRPVDEVLT